MQSRVSKWGNSLGIRIPRSVAVMAGITEGVCIDLRVEKDEIVIRKTRKYNLNEMLLQMTPENVHAETQTGTPLGSELW